MKFHSTPKPFVLIDVKYQGHLIQFNSIKFNSIKFNSPLFERKFSICPVFEHQRINQRIN